MGLPGIPGKPALPGLRGEKGEQVNIDLKLFSKNIYLFITNI